MDAAPNPAPNIDQAQRAELLDTQRQVRALAARDREVRAHEQAHAAVGGAHAGHPHYDYVRGPNGVRYATSGHVNIDISPVPGDPQATVEKMETVARAALAPAEPSPQDRAVAAKARQQAAQARAELAQQRNDEVQATGIQAEQSQPGNSGNALDTRGALVDLLA